MAKIDIISGFLGAGKTTLIKKLIKEVFAGQKVVLIENEFGEIGIDGGFLKDAGIEITEMNSGCICCSLVGDFGRALKKVVEEYHPDHILIEPSGVGKLSDVRRAIEKEAEACSLEIGSLVTVADVKKVRMYMKNFGEFYNNQIESAGTIILSRTQFVDQKKLDEAIAMIRGKNPDATIITTPWDQLSGKTIHDAMEKSVSLADQLMAEYKAAHPEETTTTTTMTMMTSAAAMIMSIIMTMTTTTMTMTGRAVDMTIIITTITMVMMRTRSSRAGAERQRRSIRTTRSAVF